MYKTILLKSLCWILLTFIFAESKAQDQQEIKVLPPKNVLKTNFLPMLWGPIPFTAEYRLVYERAIEGNHAVQIGASYLGASGIVGLNDLIDSTIQVSTQGYRIQAAYKFYLKPEAPKGFYVSPQFSYSYAKFLNEDNLFDYIEARYINGTLVFGYQLIAGGVFALDTFAGGGFKSNSWRYSDPDDTNFDDQESVSGPKLILGLNIGISF